MGDLRKNIDNEIRGFHRFHEFIERYFGVSVKSCFSLFVPNYEFVAEYKPVSGIGFKIKATVPQFSFLNKYVMVDLFLLTF